MIILLISGINLSEKHLFAFRIRIACWHPLIAHRGDYGADPDIAAARGRPGTSQRCSALMLVGVEETGVLVILWFP